MSDHSHGPEAAFRRWGYAAEREAQRSNRAVADMFPDVKAPAELEDGDQRYTTRETAAWCLKRTGIDAFDLDVAACEESHLAPVWYSKAADGLMQPWHGRVWCNPPFSDIGPWVEKAWSEVVRCESISMLLPASRTEQTWWQQLVEPLRDNPSLDYDQSIFLRTHFLPGRTRFGHPGNPEGVGVGSPPFGCVLLVFKRSNP